jgi:photosystem II stability/assembly factor-like uncharacterized protein
MSSPTDNTPIIEKTVDFWKPISATNQVNCAAIAPDGAIWIGTQSGVYQSSDGGTSWGKVSISGLTTTTNASLIRISPTGNVYGIVGTDLYLYNPSTSSWSNISQKMNTALISFKHMQTFNVDKDGNLFGSMFISEKIDLQTIGMDKNVLYKSTNSGQSWSEMKVTPSQGAVNDIGFDSKGPLYVIMDAAVYHSGDAGKTWTKTVTVLSPANPFSIAVNSTGIVQIACSKVLIKTVSLIQSWREFSIKARRR